MNTRPPLSMICPCGSPSTSRSLASSAKYLPIHASFSVRNASAWSGAKSTISICPSGSVGWSGRQSDAKVEVMPNATFANLPTTIFEEMSGLARATGAVNLGQGFPDDPGPEAIRAKAAEAVLSGYNQYPPMAGVPELRQAVAGHYARTQGL